MGPLDVEDDLTEILTRPRFPALRVAACAAALLAAAYLWLGWGWRWDVTPEGLAHSSPSIPFPGGWVGRYVRVRGRTASEARYVSAMDLYRFGSSRQRPRRTLWLANWLQEPSSLSGLGIVKFHNGRPESGVFVKLGLGKQPTPLTVSGRLCVSELLGFPADSSGGYPFHSVPDALTVDTTRGRVDGYAAIAIVLTFWSV
ncbi:MAG: hypothetical protein ACYTFI_25860, partial [Planctomycetota bacterium]